MSKSIKYTGNPQPIVAAPVSSVPSNSYSITNTCNNTLTNSPNTLTNTGDNGLWGATVPTATSSSISMPSSQLIGGNPPQSSSGSGFSGSWYG
jgi:hypothetical protein